MMSELFDEEAMRKQLDVAHRKRYMEQGMKKGMEQGMEKGMKKGMEQGIEKGKIEEKTETVLALMSYGTPCEDIAKITRLSLDKVKELAKQSKSVQGDG